MCEKQRPCGFYPFWFWNGCLEENEIRWQIKAMHKQGIKGFFIHPRQGLRQPYLSAEFFKAVDTAVKCAEQCGMEVHLYDEYPYPSGVGGGEVILGNPQYQGTALVQKIYDVNGGGIRLAFPQGKILSVMAYPLRDFGIDWDKPLDLREHTGMVLTEDSYIETGLTSYNQKRYFASNPTPILETVLPQGQYRIFVSVQQQIKKFKYWDGYVDVLNPDAVREFMEVTHERYKKRYGRKFGNTIVSIFVDEIAPSWSHVIPREFEAEYGYDLCPLLPALQDETHPRHVEVSWNLYNLKYKLFCKAFEEPISRWCQDNNLLYSGEKPGQRFSQLEYMDIPGCDPGHIKAGGGMDLIGAELRKNAKAAASAAHFFGKVGSLCECYHSLGWSATLQDAKLIAEGLMLLGVNYIVPHGFFYTTHGLAKHDAPPSFFYQMPYWPLFGELSARIEELNTVFQDTYIDADVLVIDANAGMPTQMQKQVYENILAVCMEHHLDFHIADESVLERANIEAGAVHYRGVSAGTIIVPPMQKIGARLERCLAAFRKAGGVVIDGFSEDSKATCRKRITSRVSPYLSIQTDGKEVSGIWSVKRVKNGKPVWFLLNTTSDVHEVVLNAPMKLREVPLQASCPPMLRYENDTYARTIHPFESLVLEGTAEENTGESPPRGCLDLEVKGDCEIGLLNKNLLRLYNWQMTVLDRSGTPLHTADVPAVPLSNQLEYGRFPFIPEYKTYFGHAPELGWPSLQLCYEYTFLNSYSGEVELIMEPNTIGGDWSIQINGGEPIKEDLFAESEAHTRGSLGVDITRYLVQGQNVIRIEIAATAHSDGLNNPLYLAGDFGVKLDPLTLVERKQSGKFEDYEDNLLPYYAGVIEYKTGWELTALPQERETVITLGLEREFRQAAEISINGGQFRPVLWEPRKIILKTETLRLGYNDICVRVYTNLSRSFEGQWFDYSKHVTKTIGNGI